MTNDTPSDRIIARLKAAQARAQKEKEAQTGERLLTADFQALAKSSAEAEFEKIEQLLANRATAINAQNIPGTRKLNFIKVNHWLEVGQRYAVTLEPVASFQDFLLTVRVGVHPNANVSMAEMPDIGTVAATFHAEMDDTGFFWRDINTFKKYSSAQIVDDALDNLCDQVEKEF